MADKKRQHFVPKFYLKRFTPDEKLINLYNLKSRKKVIGASLKEQCYENYFYGKDLKLENALGDAEGEIAKVFQALDHFRRPPQWGSPGHFVIVIHILMQHSRTLYAAESVNETTDKLSKAIMAKQMQEEHGIDIAKYKIGMTGASTYSLPIEISAYPLLYDLQCKLLINRTATEFITSDNPVVLYNQFMDYRTEVSNCGFASKGLQIFFPLDKEKLIALYDHRVYRLGSNSNFTIELSHTNDVDALNILQFCSAHENIYFNDIAFDADALAVKAAPFLRTAKADVVLYPPTPTETGSAQVVQLKMADIRTDFSVTDMQIRKSAKQWLRKFRKQKEQPVIICRDDRMVEVYKGFFEAASKGEYQWGDFFQYLRDKHGNEPPEGKQLAKSA
jgi:hypothetical protein